MNIYEYSDQHCACATYCQYIHANLFIKKSNNKKKLRELHRVLRKIKIKSKFKQSTTFNDRKMSEFDRSKQSSLKEYSLMPSHEFKTQTYFLKNRSREKASPTLQIYIFIYKRIHASVSLKMNVQSYIFSVIYTKFSVLCTYDNVNSMRVRKQGEK